MAEAEVEKLKDQLARAMKGFTVTKQQLQLKIAEAEQAKGELATARAEVAALTEERNSGAPTFAKLLSTVDPVYFDVTATTRRYLAAEWID